MRFSSVIAVVVIIAVVVVVIIAVIIAVVARPPRSSSIPWRRSSPRAAPGTGRHNDVGQSVAPLGVDDDRFFVSDFLTNKKGAETQQAAAKSEQEHAVGVGPKWARMDPLGVRRVRAEQVLLREDAQLAEAVGLGGIFH